MKATVNTKIFTDTKQGNKAFRKGDEWSGTASRFEEINTTLEKKHGIKNALVAVEEKEAKPKTETKERKIKGETK